MSFGPDVSLPTSVTKLLSYLSTSQIRFPSLANGDEMGQTCLAYNSHIQRTDRERINDY